MCAMIEKFRMCCRSVIKLAGPATLVNVGPSPRAQARRADILPSYIKYLSYQIEKRSFSSRKAPLYQVRQTKMTGISSRAGPARATAWTAQERGRDRGSGAWIAWQARVCSLYLRCRLDLGILPELNSRRNRPMANRLIRGDPGRDVPYPPTATARRPLTLGKPQREEHGTAASLH